MPLLFVVLFVYCFLYWYSTSYIISHNFSVELMKTSAIPVLRTVIFLKTKRRNILLPSLQFSRRVILAYVVISPFAQNFPHPIYSTLHG